MTAQNEQDSLDLLKFLERLAGEENNPNRLSLKKEKELADKLSKETNVDLKQFKVAYDMAGKWIKG